jgi:hypothetical protein
MVETLEYSDPEEGFVAPVGSESSGDCCIGGMGNMHESTLYLAVQRQHQIVMVNFERDQALSVVAGNGVSGNAC